MLNLVVRIVTGRFLKVITSSF